MFIASLKMGALVAVLAVACCGARAADRQMFDVRTPMRDGVELSSDVWLPAAAGKYPVILTRTPYIKTERQLQSAAFGSYFAGNGYAFVVQDVRGRGDSGGEFNFLFQEANDGHDTIEWLARQPWSNGRVCMMGFSYAAAVQLLAARERPANLVCLAPTSPSGRYLDELPAFGGAFMMFWAINWLNDISGRTSQMANTAAVDWQKVFSHRPLLTMDEALGRRMRLYREFLEHDTLDDYWKRIQMTPAEVARIDLPLMFTTGWFDGDQAGTLYYWQAVLNSREGGSGRYLTIGSWNHVESFMGGAEKQGELSLPKASIIDNKAQHLAFFDRYLKQSTNTLDWPRVRLFITGSNEWRSFDSFPVRGVRTERLYLSSGGNANGPTGGGVLTSRKPARERADEFVFDPKNPVPLDFAAALFGSDRRKPQAREDVLVYSTPLLEKAVEVIGTVLLELYAATDARDTDFTAAISDVHPDGRAVLLGSKPVGIIRARYRGGPTAKPELLDPGAVQKYSIDLGAIGHRFLPGHRIRVEVSSSAYPMFNPNQNTGNPIATDTEWKMARQRIFHDTARPSALVLSVFAASSDIED